MFAICLQLENLAKFQDAAAQNTANGNTSLQQLEEVKKSLLTQEVEVSAPDDDGEVAGSQAKEILPFSSLFIFRPSNM